MLETAEDVGMCRIKQLAGEFWEHATKSEIGARKVQVIILIVGLLTLLLTTVTLAVA